MDLFNYKRRPTCSVMVGGIPMGSDHPVRIQSMTNTSTMDTDGSLKQIKAIADAGACYVRLTAQGVREAENIGLMRRTLHEQNRPIPLVADIHFNPRAALAAAEVVDKVRINPGNFVDPGRTFRKLEYTDEEYASEIMKIEQGMLPLLDICKAKGTALRIGVNHGSLSDRIMSRYGDTPAGMVESAMEFLRVCVKHHFMNVVISIKASNTVVMVETVRRLVIAMDAENMNFPLHLGVTEAGDGEDGRVKSAVGIGTLMSQGIGDTIRVSLSEAPEAEVPVAQFLADYMEQRAQAPEIPCRYCEDYNPVMPCRLTSRHINGIGETSQPVVVSDSADAGADIDLSNPGKLSFIEFDASLPVAQLTGKLAMAPDAIIILHSNHLNAPGELQATRHAMVAAGIANPVIMRLDYNDTDASAVAIKAGADFGTLLLNGHRDGIWLNAPEAMTPQEAVQLSLCILQAARQRFTRTEFISCPGCGRTLFDLQSTVKAVKAAVSHLKGLKIGIMGCIVNGPGEMADADYGYVGAAAGHISLYKGKQCVEKNIPAEEAIPHLINLIKQSGDWVEP